jgi:hypothetical protein
MTNYNLQDFVKWLGFNETNYRQNLRMFALDWENLWPNGKLDEEKMKKIGDKSHKYFVKIQNWKSEVDQIERPVAYAKPSELKDIVNAQEWLDKNYPQEGRSKIIELNLNNKGLQGSLVLSGFTNLLTLDLTDNPITSLDLSVCPNLDVLECLGCSLIDLDISHNLKLSYLACNPILCPLQTLTQKIQTKEKELATLQIRDKETRITQLEQELQSLKELKIRLETQAQQREEELTKELNQIKQQKRELETKLQTSENTLQNARQQLDQIKSELSKKDQQRQELTNQLNTEQTKSTEFKQQLTTLAISSGLLTQQVENLTQQLSESQQQEKKNRLEAEIRGNLVREQGDKINQQEQQIHSYQQLLRTSEENLKKCQDIISQKTNHLEQLEQEKNSLQQALDQAQEKIKDLEQSLLTSQTKIQQLEAKIKELESKGNSSELERLKQELAEEKKKNQQEINRLKNELNQTKLKEEQLSQKIKELSKRPVQVKETQEAKSFWQTIKTPLLYLGGGIIVIIALGWIISAIKEE